MLYNICFLFFLFLSYSVMGWIIECITCSITDKKFVHDRGFLLGPYCPIYGSGALYMYFFLDRYQDDPIVLFVMAVVGTSILEYITSWFMEKIFKARWWDYSDRKFNLEGRICLLNAILFGVLGLVFTYIVNPNYSRIVKNVPESFFIPLVIFLFILFIVDCILSFTIITKLKLEVDHIKKDSTSDIDKQIKEFLSHYSFFIRRLLKAFPGVNFVTNAGNSITTILKTGLEKIDIERRKNKMLIKELKEKAKEKLNKDKK